MNSVTVSTAKVQPENRCKPLHPRGPGAPAPLAWPSDASRSPRPCSRFLPCHGQRLPRPDGSDLGPSQVLFCYEQFDELTLLHLREFDRKKLISVETDIVIDHYKEEKFEDSSPGWPVSLLSGHRCGWGPGAQGRPSGPGSWCCRHRAFSILQQGVYVGFAFQLASRDQAGFLREAECSCPNKTIWASRNQ